MIESPRRHGHSDPRYRLSNDGPPQRVFADVGSSADDGFPPIAAWENEGGSAARADDLRARTFEWSAFSARRFPDRDRHDLVALAAYGKYRAGMDAPAPLGADAARLRL